MGKEYKGKTPKELLEEANKLEKAKTDYDVDMTDIEGALTDFIQQSDPLVWTDPKTGKKRAIAKIQRPTMKQLKELVPPEFRKYADNPKDVPEELNEKYERFMYQKMAEMITEPKYTAEEWAEKASPWLIREFWGHINNIIALMEGQIEGF